MRTGAFDHEGETFLLHVHVVPAASPEVREFREFRDRLLTDPTLLADYLAAKEAILERGVLDSQDYAESKGRFINSLGYKGADGG